MLFEMLRLAQKQAVQQLDVLAVAGRVQWQDEVRPSDGCGNDFCNSDLVVGDAF